MWKQCTVHLAVLALLLLVTSSFCFVLVFEVLALMCFQFLCGLSLFLLFAVLGTEPRALYMEGKCSTPEPAPDLSVFIERLVQVVTGRQGEDGATCWVECERKDR